MGGVIHVGTHSGDDLYLYNVDKVIGFEPIQKQCRLFNEKHPNFECYNIALSDYDGIAKFYITADGADGQCSSLLKPKKAIENMTGLIKEEIDITVRRFDNWAKTKKLDLSNYHELIIDVQGNELQTLKGFGKLLNNFCFIKVECSEEPLYDGAAKAEEVVSYLNSVGFEQFSPIVRHGDIVFIKRGAWYEKTA